MAKLDVQESKYGEILFERFPSLIFNREYIPELQAALVSAYGSGVQQVIYRATKSSAASAIKLIADSVLGSLGRLDAKMLAVELLKQFPKRGYGETELVQFDATATRFVVRVFNCFNSKGISNPEHFCAVAAGLIAGGAFIVTHKDMEAAETRCTARGDAYCEFELSPVK